MLAESRTFTITTGSTIQGELVSINLDVVTIKRVDGPLVTVKASNFSAPDIAYLQAHGLKQAGVASPLAGAMKERPFVNSLGMKFVPVADTQVLFCTTLTRTRASPPKQAGRLLGSSGLAKSGMRTCFRFPP